MANAKFAENAKVRVYHNGRVRLGRVTSVVTGSKRQARRHYFVAAESNGEPLGKYRSNELWER